MCEDIQRKNAFSGRTTIVTFVEVKEHLCQTFLNNRVVRIDEIAPDKSNCYTKNGYQSIFGQNRRKCFLNERACLPLHQT
jgi:hypothetical protein